jgi:holo-[acyl-carrier protein] synthase
MIIGIGIDGVTIDRIEDLWQRFGDRFLHKVFTPPERAYATASRFPAATLANRFAAKEAALKALGTGLSQGVSWQDVSVSRDARGKPGLEITGQALSLLSKQLPPRHQPRLHLSLSHTETLAQAMVVIEAILP